MRSSADPQLSAARRSAWRTLDGFRIWNRKGHYYIGLYFLFFLWLFAFTGLLLNHSWAFTEFWPTRKVSKYERPVEPREDVNDLDRARDAMRQLGIEGEVEWTAASSTGTALQFRVNRPGRNVLVIVDSEQQRATVEQTDINAWGTMRVLHTFTGVREGDERNRRDWLLTTVWALSMDAVALGMVLMVLSGIYIWLGTAGKRNPGLAVLGAGTVMCSIFVLGLSWLYT